MGTCNICKRENIETTNGICSNCIKSERQRERRKRAIIKISIASVIFVIGFFALLNLENQGKLEGTLKNVSETAPSTAMEIKGKSMNFTKSLEDIREQILDSISQGTKYFTQGKP